MATNTGTKEGNMFLGRHLRRGSIIKLELGQWPHDWFAKVV